jgi:hypothetical protein
MRGIAIVPCLVLLACGRLGFDEHDVAGADVAGPDASLGDPGLDSVPVPDGGVAPPPPGAERLVYFAAIAECVNPNAPSLTSCAQTNGSNQLVVDGNDGQTEDPWESYLRFDLDGRLAGRQVVGVTLVMTVTNDVKADGPDSGDVWRVANFDRASLAIGAPKVFGSAPLAASRGRVEQNDVVQWTLPINTCAGSSVYLGVITTSQSGGVNYWQSSPSPPQLLIDVE